MNPSQVLFLAFLIGAIAGLRSLTAPSVVAWAAHLNWLNLRSSPLSFMGSTVAVVVSTLLALAELVADQLPSTPSRLKPPGLISRIVFGALSGAAIAASAVQSMALGSVLGGVGGIAGAFAGYETCRFAEGMDPGLSKPFPPEFPPSDRALSVPESGATVQSSLRCSSFF